jgi:hypothetical protein
VAAVVTSEPAAGKQRAAHWDGAYEGSGPHSWDQPVPQESLSALETAGLSTNDSVIDIGGGTSALVDHLLRRGIVDLTVLDISTAALRLSRDRLADRADEVEWIVTDLLSWTPQRRYDIWHDRAVFHFLTEPEQRHRYRAALLSATAPGSRSSWRPSPQTDRRTAPGSPCRDTTRKD